MSDNLRIYDAVRKVPQEAIRPIAAGRLKGMSDINPMWRIKKLTEMFGPCGEGWYYTDPDVQYIPGASGTIACIVHTSISYKTDDGWSHPVPGIGGSMYVSQEKNGLYTDDEAPKKALTDALSVACKALGIGADVYWEKDRTKYTEHQKTADDAAQKPTQKPAQQDRPQPKAEKPKSQPATEEQIAYIINNTDDQTYQNAMMAFGANLERMTFRQAEKLIERINNLINMNEEAMNDAEAV